MAEKKYFEITILNFNSEQFEACDHINSLRKVLKEIKNDANDDGGYFAYEESYKFEKNQHKLGLYYFFPSGLLEVGKRWGMELEKLRITQKK
jgi:hypothetical protein